MIRALASALVLAALAAGPALAAKAPPLDAKVVHDQAITLDTHLDTPANFSRPGWDIMDRHKVTEDSRVDYPRMVEGGLDGGFFAIYTGQGPRTPEGDAAARDAAIIRAVEIHQMVAKHGDTFELALKAADAAPIVAKGKKFVFMSIENSYPLEGDLTLMDTFYKLGVRMIGPIHFKNNDLGDSATDKPEWNGLSPRGKDFVVRANRLGMVLDASHASDDVLSQMIDLSKTPVVLSHSGLKAIYSHPRNIDDALLRKLAAKGGVIQVNALSAYMIDTPKNAERDAALAELIKEAGPRQNFTPRLRERYAAIQARYPVPRATFDDYMKHMLHALKVAGVDHVGVGADMDGGGGLPGFEDVADYPKVTVALIKAGYGQADIDKIWGGNVLRVLKAAEDYAASLKTAEPKQ